MKRVLSIRKGVLALLLALSLGMGTAYAYNFSAVCSTGQTLYYNITDATNHYVEITCPGSSSWSGYTQPTGNIELPSYVTHNGVTYTVTAIGYKAFFNCSGLTGSLTIPNTVTSIGHLAFQGCSGFRGSLTFGTGVTSIGMSAFYGCTHFSGSLTIPDSVTEIQNSTFWSCSGFTGSLIIPNSVTSIGATAFQDCTGFTGSLTLGTGVTSIDNDAFYRCTGFTSITAFPETPPTLGTTVFYNVPTTIPVFVPCALLEAYQNAPGWSSFSNLVESCPQQLTVNNGPEDNYYVPVFGWFCDHYSKSQFIIPASDLQTMQQSIITKLTFYALNTNVSWGDARFDVYLAEVEETSFGSTTLDWTGMTKVLENASLSVANNKMEVVLSLPYLYQGGNLKVGIKQVVSGNNVTSKWYGVSKNSTVAIGGYEETRGLGFYQFLPKTTFDYFSAPQTSIEFADPQVKNICVANWDTNHDGELSYDEAAAVTELGTVFGETSITSFDELQYFTGLSYILDEAFFSCEQLTSVIIPSGVGTIYNNAFTGCSSLTSIIIPSSVHNIHDNPFMSCPALANIVVEAGNTVYDSRDNCNAIIVTATNTLKTGCINTVIPNNIEAIGIGAFWGCTGLTSIAIPNSVTIIGGGAFRFCSSLESFVFPNSVTYIGNVVFEDCTSLTSLTVPAATPPSLETNTFYGISTGIPVYVPCGSLAAYQAAAGWSNFTNIQCDLGNIVFVDPAVKAICVQNWDTNGDGELSYAEAAAVTSLIPEGETNSAFYQNTNITSFNELQYFTGLEVINNEAFYNCRNLTQVTFPNSVISIMHRAFSGCHNLTSVTIPNSVIFIGQTAFGSCNLTSIVIPSSVTTIDDNPFSACSSLAQITVDEGNQEYSSPNNCNAIIETGTNTLVAGCKNTVIPEGVTTIAWAAFNYCNDLAGINIPSSVTRIGELAFRHCTGLTTLTIPSAVNYIGGNAFLYCTGLTEITVLAPTPPELDGYVFSTDMLNIPVYVPYESYEAYQTYDNGSPWGGFTNIIGQPYSAFPYVNDFETSCGWQLINGDLTNQWTWGEAGTRNNHHLYISDNSGVSCNYTINSSAMVYATKMFHFEEGWYRFQYDWLAYGESNYDYLRVALVPASVTLSAGTSAPSGFSYNSLPSGWIALDGGQQLNMNAWWQTTFSEINVPAGDYMMVFAWHNDNSDGYQPPAAIDNVSIRPVSCLAPVGLTAQHVGRTQVTLDWTPVGNEDEWEVWLSWPNGNETWSMPYTATTHPFTISGLGAGVTYTATVNAKCGPDNTSYASNEISFTTTTNPCDDPATFPFTENFDGYTGTTSGSENVLPDCWSCINTTTVSSQQGYPTIFQGSYAQSAPNFLYFMSTYAVGYFEDPQDQYAILPSIDNVSDLVLSLYARIPAEGRNATFMVGVMTDPEDASTFTELVTLQPTSTTYTHYSIPLGNYTGNGWYIAIKMPAASSSVNYRGLCIDDVAVDHVITFADPAVKALCVASSTGWDTNGDGELSYAEAEAVTSLDGVFSSEAITSFNELQYFTGLEYLDDDAFYWCDQLTSVIIPSSVTDIGGSAFSDCSSLTSVTIPSSVTDIGGSAFSDCSSLTSVTIPSSVTSIGSNAFNGSGLTEMTVEATTPPTLGNNAFQNVPTDIPVYVPCNTKAAYQAASGWSDFTNIIDLCDAIVFADANVKAICVQHWDTNGDGELSYGEAAAVTTLKPSGAENSVFWNTEITSFDELQYFTGLTSIEENAFMFCNSLTSVTLPNAVTSIGSYAFAHCISLTSVSLPNSLTTIGDFAFTNATSLSTIELPLSLMGIGARAFDNCGLVSVVIPASVMGIGINPFTYCSSLTSITVDGPSNVFYTPNDNALVNSQTQTLVTGLSTTIIPNTVTTIGAFAFDGCINLTSITIPNSVTYIDNLAFHYCIGLTSITVEATTPPTLGNDVFQAVPVDIPVYVPCESLAAYQTYDNGQPWGGFTNIKTLNEHFPWTEDFENYAGLNNNNTNYNTMPSCWSSIHGANPAQNYYDRYPSVYTYSSYAHSGSNFIFFADNYNTDYTHSDQYAILPPVENVNQMTLSLYALKEYRTAYFEVGVMTDPDDASTFTMVGSATATTTHTLYSFSFANYTGTGTYIAIRMPKAADGNNRGVCIDDVTLDHIITFADANVKALCVAHWDTNGDNELSYAEAAAVTSLGQVFQNAFQAEGTIVTFDELQYFTGLTSINDNAFAGCWRLSSIMLPPHVEAIGNNAFGMCSALTSITLPNTVTSIGYNAFQYCMNLTTIEFPDALTTIGSRTFDYCLGLTSVEIPAAVTSIGLNPFTGCNNLASITVAEGNTVYSSPNNNALVETATHKLVSGLNNTVIPDDIQIIGNFAFNGLYGLTSLVIPAFVTDIYYEAFGNCSNLAELTVLATTPPTLGNNAFFNVPTTIPVYVPCGTKEAYQAAAGWSAFTNFVDLCDVIVFADANVKAICVQNWDTNHDGELSYGEAAAVTTLIPDGASNSAFRNTTITSFNELQYFTGLSSIETLAFHLCTSLTSVIIPSGVDSIGVNPFSYCPALESITVMAGNTVYDSRGNCNAIIETATNTLKAGCKNTVIPSEVTSIASGAFDYCTSLLSITIPSGVAFIDNYVFYQCSGLTSITVEATTPPTANSVTFIGVPRNIPVYVPCNTKAAYQAASGWSDFINIIDLCDAIVFADANVKAICVQNWDTNGDGELSYGEAAAVTSLGQVFQNAFQEEGTNVTFNELQYFSGLTSIGANAFAGCWRLTSVTLPPTVTTIGSNAFTMCSGLASSPITNHVTEIGDYAFNYCYSLTEIELPSSVTSIGNRAFDRCYYLTSVVIPASVTSIGINPFSGCTRLASIVVDEGNTVYGSPNGCNAIINTEEHLLVSGCNNTNIPDGVQTIGWYAFLASGLTTLTIPASVNSIADYAFSECEALSELTLLATTPPTLEGTDVFSYINLDIPVYVPCESLEAYQTYNNGQPWGGFTNIRCDVCSAELPLSENFDSYQGTTSGATNVLPDCWDRINTAVDIAYTGYPTILNEPANAYSGSNYLRFHYNQGYGSEQYVILPYVDDIAEVNLWFYAKALTENAAIFVGVMTDPNDVSTFETAFEIDNLTSDYQQCNVSIDPEYINDQTHYIAIKSGANNGATLCDLCIDNLELLRITQQNLTLSEGWNWWTPTVRTYRSALQYALGSNGIIINSQNQGFQKNNGNYWSGTLPGVLEPGQMYKIKTNASVSATLQGLEVAQPTITIVTGYNWFGYAGAQAADIATAIDILGVSPTDGDIITDKNGNTATYNGSGWSGTLTTLQPGHGYVYRRQ